MDEARELVALAAEKGLRLTCAPSNALGDTTQTMWKAVRDGAVGDVRMVYAEMDDNPIYLMSPGSAGAVRRARPGPTCTNTRGLHLRARRLPPDLALRDVRAGRDGDRLLQMHRFPTRPTALLDPPDTPDFSVACLDFRLRGRSRASRASIGAPFDHRMRIIGNKGMLTADTYRHYRCPVYLERFSKLSLNARKSVLGADQQPCCNGCSGSAGGG